MANANELRELAKLAREQGDEELELKALEQLEQITEGGMVSGVVEPVRAIGSGLLHTVAGGLGGIVGTAAHGPEVGADIAASTQQQAFKPETQSGQENLKAIGEGVKYVMDTFNIPISGIAGIVELVSGQGVDQAVSTIQQIQAEGVSKTLGSRTLEETGSPLAAAAAHTAPTAVAEAFGLKGAGAAARGAKAATKGTGGKALALADETAQAVRGFQSPAKRDIARQFVSKDVDKNLAAFDVVGKAAKEPTRLQQLTGAGLPKVVAAKEAREAMRQGFPDYLVESIKKSTTKPEKRLMVEMVNIGDRVRRDPLGFGADNAPGQVVGRTLLNDVNRVKEINRKAGREIGSYEKTLIGQKIPASHIGDKFLESLDSLEIKVLGDGRLDFKDSLVAGQGGRISSINKVYNRMRRNRSPDAFDVHRLKQFVDETVSYGKSVRGLSGKAEGTLRELRHDIKTTLNDHFPDYAAANKAYSDSINVLDEIQRIAGKHTNLTKGTAESQLGILSKRLTSNLQSRSQLENVIDQITTTLKEHGGMGRKLIEGKSEGKVSLRTLNQFANEMEKTVGSFAGSSFTGGLEKAVGVASAIPASPVRGGVTAADLAISGIEKVRARSINEQAAFKSLRDLLNRELKR